MATTTMMEMYEENETEPFSWYRESYCAGSFVRCPTYNSTIPTNEEAFGATETIWVMTSCILIFQMQTGFGLLEAGSVTSKSETNIMVKNSLDLVFGGITYWAFGFACSFGDSKGHNPFIGVGHYFLIMDETRMGFIYALFLFQLSFATTSMTIVSGAMAERTKLISYNVFSMCMTFIYALPAHWLWAGNGFLLTMGAQDIAGCGPVHLVGGVTGLVATLILGPRKGAFDGGRTQCPSPVKSILGMFMLWWGWLRFNSGSVYIVTAGDQWKYAVKAGVNTIIASMGGGVTSVICSLSLSKWLKREKRYPYDVGTIVNGILGGLVSITSICTLCEPWEAFIIGIIGALITVPTEMALRKLKIDDPVGVIPVHGVCAIWGLLSVGLFIPEKESTIPGQGGLFRTGQFYLLGVQLLSVVVIIVWTIIFAAFFLKIIDLTMGLRLTDEHEIIGADTVEHGTGGMFNFTDRSADATLCLTGLGSHILENEFKIKLNQMLKDLFRSVARNELFMTLHPTEGGSLSLEIRNSRTQPTVNGSAGCENKGFESSTPSLKTRITELQTSEGNYRAPNSPTHGIKKGHLPRTASAISLSSVGAEIRLTDEQGRHKTQIISSEKPTTPGFIATNTSL